MSDPNDPWAVVGNSAAVRGVGRLRVVDASILPHVPSTTTNVTTIMLAEHISRRYYELVSDEEGTLAEQEEGNL